LITIPNNTVASSIVKNVSASDKRSLDETIKLPRKYSVEQLEKAIDIIKNILQNNHDIHADSTVFLETLNINTAAVRFIAFAKYPDIASLREIRQNILKEILRQFNAAGLELLNI